MNTKESPRGPLEPLVGRLRDGSTVPLLEERHAAADLLEQQADEIKRLQADAALAKARGEQV